MRVQFAPCGVGLGHAGRCIPIARELQARDKATEIYFSTYHDATDYIQKEGFPAFEVPAMDFKAKPDGTVDFTRTAMNPGPFIAPFNFLEQVGKEIEIMEAFEPDIVVSDSRASPIVAARILRIPSLCILNQFQVIIPRKTRLLRLAKFADAITLAIIGRIWAAGAKVIIPDLPPPYTISTNNLRVPRSYQKKIQFIGPILPMQMRDLPTKSKLRRKLNVSQDRPVIFAPISGPLKERAYLIKILKRLFKHFPDSVEIIMSLGYPGYSEKPEKNSNLSIARWIPNRFEYMKASDIVISRAGHGTILQTMCFGKPSILIPTPSHTEQLNNAKKCESLGFSITVEQDSLSREVLMSAVENILKKNRFSEAARNIQAQVHDLDGLKTAVEMTLEVAQGG